MRQFAFALALILAGSTASVAQDQTTTASADELKTLKEKAAYTIGYRIGSDVRGQLTDEDVALDLKVVLKGIMEALEEKENRLTEEEAIAVMTQFQQEVQARQQARMVAAAEKNQAEAAAFLEKNKAKEGVKVTESGLQYEVVSAGEGASPAVDSTVKVHYKGTLPDGSVFDSSYERGSPAVFNVSGVIRGWTEALPMMTVGSKWKLYIPPNLGYGAQGSPPAIMPNQLLIFEVELLEIVE